MRADTHWQQRTEIEREEILQALDLVLETELNQATGHVYFWDKIRRQQLLIEDVQAPLDYLFVDRRLPDLRKREDYPAVQA